MTLAGEKKCMPSTSWGREVTAAISSTSSVEVFEASTQPGLHLASRSLKIFFFRSMFSNTASMTMSASATSSKLEEGVMLASAFSTCASVRPPRAWVAR